MKTPVTARAIHRSLARLGLGVGLAAFAGIAAQAHEFTAAILVRGPNAETRLAEAIDGFLLAADERDGHALETSDGHLGGVDVQILALPREAAGRVRTLAGSPRQPPDVVVVIGTGAGTDPAPAIAPDAITFVQAGIPADSGWADSDRQNGFFARFVRAYATAPTEAAAQGYLAARRLDAAIRPHDGLAPRDAIEAALAEPAGGTDWWVSSDRDGE